MLATAVCAVMAGACTFAAMADWVRDLDPPGWTKLGFTDGLPVPTTLWRLLVRIDDTALSAVLPRWVRSRATRRRGSATGPEDGGGAGGDQGQADEEDSGEGRAGGWKIGIGQGNGRRSPGDGRRFVD